MAKTDRMERVRNGEKNDMTGDEKGKARKEQTHNPILR